MKTNLMKKLTATALAMGMLAGCGISVIAAIVLVQIIGCDEKAVAEADSTQMPAAKVYDRYALARSAADQEKERRKTKR